jgi:hypothetical protein
MLANVLATPKGPPGELARPFADDVRYVAGHNPEDAVAGSVVENRDRHVE